MTAYRFCRSDDITLLVDALNRCWSPYFPDEPPLTPAEFKRSIRDLQVWCSSCMVAFAGPDPIGVLIGAKRPSGTFVHRIAVHPDHRRQGHAHHLLESLGSKLAILGPPRMIAEVPETLAPACHLFSAGGYVREALLTDYVVDLAEVDENDAGELASVRHSVNLASGRLHAAGGSTSVAEASAAVDRARPPALHAGQFVIPVSVDDLEANGLLASDHRQVCWERSVETLTARKDDIAGLAVASDERIEACLLYVVPRGVPERNAANAEAGCPPEASPSEIVSLRMLVDDGGARLRHLLCRLRERGVRSCRFPKVHPAEFSRSSLETLGFRPAGDHVLYAATARSA